MIYYEHVDGSFTFILLTHQFRPCYPHVTRDALIGSIVRCVTLVEVDARLSFFHFGMVQAALDPNLTV